jgi:HD-GYP domain-containing protein (c-di-GMP phosphodiesterase class II)
MAETRRLAAVPGRHSLRSSVHRALAIRVIGVGMIAAFVFAGFSYWRAYQDIGDTVLERAQDGVEWLRHQARARIEVSGLTLQEAVQQTLEAKSKREIDPRHGQFVRVRFDFADGTPIALWTRPTTKLPEALFEQRETRAAKRVTSGVRATPFWFEGIRLIDLTLPLEIRDGRTLIAHAIFEVSATARSRVRRDALLAALEAFLIVAITTAVLYPVVLTLIRRLARYSESLLDSNLETLALLGGAIAKKDSDTDAHNYRVTLYAVRLAEAVGLPDDEIKKLIKGGFLHDVGKIGIADAVLLKPGRLDEEEFRIMKTHVDHGLDIVDRSRWLKDAKEVVGGHHEKFDGTGYPQGLAGEAIPVGARVFAIADVFDALTSRRPYKTPFPFEETMRILDEGRGRHFDPKILDRFALIAGELHAEYCGREDDGLREALNAVVKRYFNDGTETLA